MECHDIAVNNHVWATHSMLGPVQSWEFANLCRPATDFVCRTLAKRYYLICHTYLKC